MATEFEKLMRERDMIEGKMAYMGDILKCKDSIIEFSRGRAFERIRDQAPDGDYTARDFIAHMILTAISKIDGEERLEGAGALIMEVVGTGVAHVLAREDFPIPDKFWRMFQEELEAIITRAEEKLRAAYDERDEVQARIDSMYQGQGGSA